MVAKIIDTNNLEDRNFINNDPILKKSFENIYNEWNKFLVEKDGRMRIRLPNLIEKYKDNLQFLNNKYFSLIPIFYSSDDIFENFKDCKISILIIDNKIEAFAVGITWPDCYYISHVRSNIKVGCSNVISKLIDSWWDKRKISFYSIDSIEYPLIKLHVDEKNLSAVGCYKKFGFKMTTEILKGDTVMELTKEAYVEKYLLQKKIEHLKTIQKIKNNDSKEELKIIDSNIKEDKDFIINNPNLAKGFEDMEYFWNEYTIKQGGILIIKSQHIIEKYKSQIISHDGIIFFSPTVIRLTASEIFDEYKENHKFSIMIVDDEIVAYAFGYIRENNYVINSVRSLIKGSCTKIIQNLINSYWDNDKLQFKSMDVNNDPSIQLNVIKHNDLAIGCYKKCGFEKVEETLLGYKMRLTKERYVEYYLLPQTEKKLQARQNYKFIN